MQATRSDTESDRMATGSSPTAKVWVWPVNEENWPLIEDEKKWAVDTKQKTKYVAKGDILVFYMTTRTGASGFRGVFRILTEWKKTTIRWNDGDVIFEVDLEEIETGFADISRFSGELDFVNERVTSHDEFGLALRGTTKGPCNDGNPIRHGDYEKILAELNNNKDSLGAGGAAIDPRGLPEPHKPRLKNHNIRLFLIKALFENLTGPKNGPSEENENPGFFYSVGVLRTKFRPRDVMIPSDPGQEAGRHETDQKHDRDLEKTDEETVSADQDLNPFLGARSMGISFVVSGKTPRASICLTWGRYSRLPMAGSQWVRESNFYTLDAELDKPADIYPKDGASQRWRITREGAEIRIVSRRISPDTYKVSVFLVNNTRFEGGHPTNAEHIFQPQIRIMMASGTVLTNLDALKSSGMDAEQKLLFNNRKVFASGHLCGALWEDVDPEDADDETGFGSFTWPDSRSKHFPAELRKRFTRPSVRTEYLPSYSILQPDFKDKGDIEFKAGALAETWNAGELGGRLRGLLDGYGDWISDQRENLKKSDLVDGLKAAGEKNIKKCERIYERISNGIRFLVDDERARASFCFMNRVMAVNREWESGGAELFSWREFQMAFILHCLAGVAQKNLEERDVCDILWFPTGGGKTEAYLGLMIFAIAYRRLSERDDAVCDGGVSVISRYTLRLLTIQQFQRTVRAILAADFLRVQGWRPQQMSPSDASVRRRMENGTLWGQKRFSIGLWIGDVTPNKFEDGYDRLNRTPILNAKGMLRGRRGQSKGEPAQINLCPCCRSVLAVPASGLGEGNNTIHWIFKSPKSLSELDAIPKERLDMAAKGITVEKKEVFEVGVSDNARFYCIRIGFKSPESIGDHKIINWWNNRVLAELETKYSKARLASTLPSRPGYFFVNRGGESYDFVIHCPNPECDLNRDNVWFEKDPGAPSPPVPAPFKVRGRHDASTFMPISAYTVDEQIYRRCPTVLISTVDKFAMLPYLEDSASIFGNVDSLHGELGYGRSDISKHLDSTETVTVKPFLPPSLIIQDELHLIEGPLGSVVGIYEAGMEILTSLPNHRPKYIASSATIKESASQVGAVFRRRVSIFPPTGIKVEDSYFSENKEDRRSIDERAGRLYLGISSTNRILATPIKIWSTLLGELHRIRSSPSKYFLDKKFEEDGERYTGETFGEYVMRITDPYWTLVGYFNAIRDLQIARSLYGDEIMQSVRRNSIEEFPSIIRGKRSAVLPPAVRFVPVTIRADCEISGVTVFCNNSSGHISVALYGDEGGKPGAVRAEVTEHTKRCRRGENGFQLKALLSARDGDMVWVGLINDDPTTAFQVGDGEMQAYRLSAGRGGSDVFPEDPVEMMPEDACPNVSLHTAPRDMGHDPVELTGQTESHELPHVLQALNAPRNKVDAVFTTAVFGTGVDIPRLGLMVVTGQPKTTSAYIQSTGRVGRRAGGLVVTWLRSSNVRDLNHYENFVGYHRLIQHFIEPVSAAPYSDIAMRTCLGPICVSVLRNGRVVGGIPIDKKWVLNDGGPMVMMRGRDGRDVMALVSALHEITTDKSIPKERAVDGELSRQIIEDTINRWRNDAVNITRDGQDLKYYEWAIQQTPTTNVVLGSQQHKLARKTTVYDNARTSMREVEAMANFGED